MRRSEVRCPKIHGWSRAQLATPALLLCPLRGKSTYRGLLGASPSLKRLFTIIKIKVKDYLLIEENLEGIIRIFRA